MAVGFEPISSYKPGSFVTERFVSMQKISAGKPKAALYTAPSLVVYGDMAKLTASGSGVDTENSGKDPQPTKRP